MSQGDSDPDLFEDDTIRVLGTRAEDAATAATASSLSDAADADGDVDDRTVLSSRRADVAPESDTDDLDATVLSRSGEQRAPLPEIPAEPGPRRAPAESDESVFDDPGPDEGSTMVARRETRRRAARDLEAQSTGPDAHDQVLASTRAADVPAPVRRIARAPEPAAATYAARAPRIAPVERTTHEAHAPQAFVDTAALQAAARTRRRSGLVIGVVLGLCALAAAVAGLVALATAG